MRAKPIKTPIGLVFPRLGVIGRHTYQGLDEAVVDRLCTQLSISEGSLKSLVHALDEVAARWMMADTAVEASRNDRVGTVIRRALALARAAQKLDPDDQVELSSIEAWFPAIGDAESAKRLEEKLVLMSGKRGTLPNEPQATSDALGDLLAAWWTCTRREAGTGYKSAGSAYVVFNKLAENLKVGRPRTLFTTQEFFSSESIDEFRKMLVDQFAYKRAVERRQSQLLREKRHRKSLA